MADVRVQQAIKIVDPTTDANQAGVDASGNLQVILASNTGVDIGDVDVLSVIPGTAATNLGKAENVVSAGGDTLVGMAAIQDAVLSALGSTDNDYTWLRVDANGALWSILAANDGVDIGDVDVTSVIPGTAATNLGKAIDSVVGATDTGVGILAERIDTLAAITPAVGDWTGLYANVNGALWVEHDGVIDTELPAAAALADDTANPTVPGVGGFMMGWDNGNTNWNRVEVDDAGHLQVDVLSGGGSPAAPTNPTIDTDTSAAVAAGTEVDLDSAEITEPENLTMVTVSASVAFKARITLVENGVETVIAELFGRAGTPLVWEPPDRRYCTVSNTAGVDVFRVQTTNMDTSEAADLYASFYYQSN